MGTITTRKNKNGSARYLAQILRKKDGKIVWRENKTFEREREAKAWIRYRETELDKPGTIARLSAPKTTLADAIDRYTAETNKKIGRTKAQVLRSIKEYAIAGMNCDTILSEHIVAFADELLQGNRQPQTVANYISHLAAIFRDAKPLWGIPLDYAEMQSAQRVLSRHDKITKSKQRDRRPTLDELDRILTHFADRSERVPHSAPMVKIIVFAIFSSRRQDEIARIEWADLEEDQSRIMVRDFKHPGQKKGNDVWCDLPPEALRIIKSMPRTKPQIFPYHADTISAAFTRACAFLDIKDLHFHDMRHEAVSRLFEMDWSIPHVAAVSGHRSWASLKRYTQIARRGDKYEGWHWLDRACQ